MTRSNVDPTECAFDEVAIADFGPYQIAVLTTTQTLPRHLRSIPIAVTERVYHSRGYLIAHRLIIASLTGLEIGAIAAEQALFQPMQRLAPAVNLAFEVRSTQPLPQPIAAQSVFTCQLPESRRPYRAVFRQVQPRFVRIYPFFGIAALTDQVEALQIEESRFVAQNQARLRQIPFYRATFGL